MNDSPGRDANPYRSPSTDPNAATRPTRPVGTVILAVLLLLMGLWFCGQRIPQILLALSSADVTFHPSYYVVWTRDALSATTAIGGAIGLLLGRGFGWWLSIVHGYWRLAVQSVLPLFGAIASGLNPNDASQMSTLHAAVGAAVVFLLIILYLQKSNVLAYYRVTIGRTILNIGLPVLCVAAAFGLDVWWVLTEM